MTRFDRCAGWALPLLAGVLPLVFVPSLYDSFDLPRLVLISLTSTVLTLLWIGSALQSRQGVWHATGLDCFLLLMLGVHILSALGSIDSSTSWRGVYRVYSFGVWPVSAAILLFYSTTQCAHPQLIPRLRLAMIGSGALVGFYACLQVMGIEFLSSMPKVTDGRPWSSLGNPIYVGAVCMMALFLTVGEWLGSRRDRLLLTVCAAGHLLGLFLSLSRSAWVATSLTLFYWGYQERKRFGRLVWIPVVLIIGLCLLPQTRSRLISIGHSTEHSNAARLEGWRAAVQIWKAHPILGSGPDTFFEAFRPYRSVTYLRSGGLGLTQGHAHNDLLQMAATLGLLGLLTYIGLVWQFFRKASAQPERFVLLALLVHNVFNFSSLTTTAWAAMLAAVCLARNACQWTWNPRRKIGLLLIGVVILAASMRGALLSTLCDAQVQDALTWRRNQQPVQALIRLRQAVRGCPDVAMYQTELGNTARLLAEQAAEGTLRQDLFQEAWRSAIANTRYHPQNPDVWNNRGVVAMWRTQLAGENAMADAREAFEKATTLDASFVDAWANLARWHHLAGDVEAEIRLWEKVLVLDPTHAMAREVLKR